MKLNDYSIFFELRDKYPKCTSIISVIMNYAFTNNDSIDGEYLYLGEYNGYFNEENIELIFRELGFDDIICISHTLMNSPHLLVKLNSKP